MSEALGPCLDLAKAERCARSLPLFLNVFPISAHSGRSGPGLEFILDGGSSFLLIPFDESANLLIEESLVWTLSCAFFEEGAPEGYAWSGAREEDRRFWAPMKEFLERSGLLVFPSLPPSLARWA